MIFFFLRSIWSVDFHESQKRRRLGRYNAIIQGRRTISYRIIAGYEKAFQQLGFFLARKALVVLVISVVVLSACFLGFVRFRVEQPSSDQFIVTDSQSRDDLRQAAEFFPLLEARQEQIIMTPKQGQNILTEHCLEEALLVHQMVVNTSGYKNLCLRQLFPKREAEKAGYDCIISSPLELAGARYEHLENLSSILAREWKNPMMILSTGQSFHSSFKRMLSGFEVDYKTDPPTTVADALRITYFIRKEANDEEHQKVLNFESSFENMVLSANVSLKCATLSLRTRKSTTDVLQVVLQPETRPVYLSVLIILLIVLFVIYLSSTSLTFFTRVLQIFLSVLLPLTCAAGIISTANIPFSPTTLFFPFLFLGKAMSDAVIFWREWERQKEVLSLQHRVSSCVVRAGTLHLFSTILLGTILLGIAINSSFSVISNFFVVALVGYLLVSITTFVITMTLLLSLERHLKIVSTLCSRRNGGRLPFSNCTKFCEGCMQHLQATLRHFPAIASRTLMTLPGKAMALIILACIISFCVSFALQSGERTSTPKNFYRNNDNFNQFNKAQETFFGKENGVSVVFSGETDYSNKAQQNRILDICKILGKAPYSKGGSVCWMAELLQWSQNQNLSCSDIEFHHCLNLFLNQSTKASFRGDIRFKEDSPRHEILASRIHFSMVRHNNFMEDGRSLGKLRLDLSKQSSLQGAAVSETFLELDDLVSLERETFFALVTSTVVVFVVSVFSTLFLRISTYITVTFILLVSETAGIMKVLGIHLNQITFISMFLTTVLALNPSLQVAHCFIFSEKREAQKRMASALSTIGWPVFTASLLEMCGSISLGFTYPNLRDIFFRLVPPVLALGLIHALIIAPPIITLIFELMDKFDSSNEKDMPIHLQKREMSLKLLKGESSRFKPKRPAISIVGIGCKFPGANSKDLFWELLEQGKSSIGAFPQNRRQEHERFFQLYHPRRFVSGRLCAVNGSYLEEIQKFDNHFFGISNQEARAMDPQQRILLEVVYEAIEDAGMRLEDLQKCRTGVFVGVMNLEYGALVTDTSNYNNIDQFSATGITASILANRVSFCLNFTGPSIAIDTACSSSLTALKLACDNLHNGDCEIAIVCAPNIVLNHAMQIATSMAGLLATDGRCKSFDASGDGYGRGEGFAAVILKLSHAAVSDKDDAYCEIIACGMNNDGQDAIPMTAPSSRLQANLSRMVLEQSGVNAEDVGYFEAHGTGTAIGDVVEVTSIADTYTRRATNPTLKLRIGSVKSNLNHTESTSGLAGLIKVALMIKKKRFVPTVNVHILNPKLKLEEKGLVVQQTNEPWNVDNGKARIAAVNSFGYGGSNVHAIIREVESTRSMSGDKNNRVNNVLTLSTPSEETLKRMARLYSEWLNDNKENEDFDATFVGNLCYSLNERRDQFQHRLAVPFGSVSEACKTLADYADETAGWEKIVSYGAVKFSNPKVVFMFGGQGSQWYAMGRQLIETEPVFKEAVLTVSNLVRDLGETSSLLDELLASEHESRISENSIAQPATFAIQYATAQLLMSWRIYPSAVLGHSLGEFAAACVAGIITLKEAVQLVLIRSTLQDQCPNNGGMAALGMSEEKSRTLLMELKLNATMSVAAVNDANSVTVSGDSQSVEALGGHLAIHSKETFWRVLGTKRAFHSAHMEVIKKPFQAAMQRVKLKPQLSKIPIYSTVEGEIISGEQFNSRYWWRNIRCPVLFQQAMRNVLKDGYKQIIEISTQPILAHYVKQIALQEKLDDQEIPVVLQTLPRKRVPVTAQHKSFLLSTVCTLYTQGFPIDWACVQQNPSAKFVRSLSYPWMKNSFWYRERPPPSIIPVIEAEENKKSNTHPFLGQVKMTDFTSGLHCWETEIDIYRFPNLKDHALKQGGAVMPGAAYIEMAFAMIQDQFVDAAGLELRDVKLLSLLTLPDTQVSSFNWSVVNS